MRKVLAFAVMSAVSFGQTNLVVPDGTKIRVRLDQQISSATADEGQTVELTVAEAVKVDDVAVIPEGSRVTGTITEATAKRRMGRAGKLDFSIDRVRSVDGEWIPLRYTLNKKAGESHAVRSGVITAGVAVVFWPAAPVFLLMKGKDVTINKGVTFDVFTDTEHRISNLGKKPGNLATGNGQQMPGNGQQMPGAGSGTATLTITSTVLGAEIELDGAFVGNTPTTLQVSAGTHNFIIRSGSEVWQRSMQVTPGSNVSLNADLGSRGAVRTRTTR
jgi:hypothetical protein